jgi:dienelactone hydrolase
LLSARRHPPDADVTDHAIVVPTQLGPVAGIVSEPSGEQRGALIFVQGLGQPGRAGVNANWTRLARDLARLGLVVLRFDLCSEGESTPVGDDVEHGEGWRRSTDLAVLREVAPWFMRRVGETELLLAGSCHGGRVALEFAANESAVRGLFVITPYLWAREPATREETGPHPEPVWAGGPTLNREEELAGGFAACLSRGPVWVFVGGDEVEQVQPYARRLERAGGPSFELEVAPDMPIHPVGHPLQQELVHRHLLDRVTAALAAS